MGLTRTTLGRLAAYATSPTSGVTTAFDASDWAAPTGITVSVASGRLRAVGTPSTKYIRLTALASRADVYVRMHGESVGAGGGGGGLAARVADVSDPTSAVGLQVPINVTATEQLVERVSGSIVQTDATASVNRSTPVTRTLLWVRGTAANAAVVGLSTRALTGLGLVAAGRVGWYHSVTGGAAHEIGGCDVMTDARLVVTGPSGGGWRVRVRNAGNTVIAEATESGGTATIDDYALGGVLGVAAVSIEVDDGAGTVLDGPVSPSECVWGGDVWEWAAPAPPPAPDEPTVDNPTLTTLDVSWPAVAEATSYEAERSPDGTTDWTPVYADTATGFTDTGLPPTAATWYYRVRGVNGGGPGDWSAVGSGATEEPESVTGFRLRVRNQSTLADPDGTADALVITSIPAQDHPYLASPPEGDGQEVDLLTGQRRDGTYRVRVIDAEVTSDDGPERVVTRVLEDAEDRQQLLSRRAYVEITRNGGVTWEELLAGYVMGIVLSTAIAYDFYIGDSRRIEASRRIFTWSPTAGPTGVSERDVFPSRGCLAGGPILGGFGPLNDTGGDLWVVDAVTDSPLDFGRVLLLLSPREAFLPPDWRRSRNRTDIGKYYEKALQPFAASGPQQIVTSIFELPFLLSWTRYPSVTVLLDDRGGTTWTGRLELLNRVGAVQLSVSLDPGQPAVSVGALRWLRLVPNEVSAYAPLYIDQHPVDLVTHLFDVVGIEYDQTTADAVKAALGDQLRYALRLTEPHLMDEFLSRSVFGPFGFAWRNNSLGVREFFLTRPAGDAAPTITVPTDSLRSQEPPIFSLEEESIVSSFKISYGVLSVTTLPVNASPPPPPDGIVESRVQVIVENSDQSVFSTREVAYDFAGMVHLEGAWEPSIAAFIAGIAQYGFDRYGRGAPAAEVELLDGQPGSDAQVGDEVYLDVASYPNRGARIGESSVGPRIMQVVRRTEAAGGPRLKLLDSGLDQQPVSPAAAISVAQSAAQPRTVAAFTITNAAALNAAAVLTVTVEYATAASEPTGHGMLFTRYAPGTVPAAAVALPAVRPGTTVWVRARTEQVDRRPSAWTDWESVALVAFDAPSAITLSDETAESITVQWTPDDPSYWTEVFIAPGTTDPADWSPYRVNIFQPGSTRTIVRGLAAATDYRVGVAHRDQATGERTTVTSDTTATASNPAQAPAPLAMAVIGGVEDAGLPTGIALALWAADETFDLEIERADDSSGMPGPYALLARVPGTTQVYRDLLPSDGITRWYRIRHALPGYSPSVYTGGQDGVPVGLPDELNRPVLGPVLRVFAIDGGSDVDVHWSGSGTIEVSINGSAFASPSTSPITVSKISVEQTYQFRATLNGLEAFSLIVIEANPALIPSLLTATATQAQAIDCGVSWEIDVAWTTDVTNDIEYRVRILNADTLATVADSQTTAGDTYTDDTTETGDPLFTGFPHTRQYTVQVVRNADDVVVDSLTTNRLDVETGPSC